ncbi:MAG: ABC transporter substrate-binding protein, partial [Solirubrobacterales bacterium]
INRLDAERIPELPPFLLFPLGVGVVGPVSSAAGGGGGAGRPGRPRVVQQDPSTLGEVLDDMVRLGEAAGIPVRAQSLRKDLERRIAEVRDAVTGAPRPRVLALEWLDPPFLGGHWIPEMIEIAGGEDVAGRAGAKSAQVGWGDLRDLDLDLIVAMPCGWYLDDSRAQALAHRDRLDALGARRLFAVDAASSFSRPGPRLVDGVELLGHLFHPLRVQPPQGIGFARIETNSGVFD